MGGLPDIYSEDDYQMDLSDDAGGNRENGREPTVPEDPDSALIHSRGEYGYIHLPDLRRRTHLSNEALIGILGLYQDPVKYDMHQDPEADYLDRYEYLSGKHAYKLLYEAQEMNEKYNGRFQRNIELIKQYMPEQPVLTADDIPFRSKIISGYEYGRFLKELFGLKLPPKVTCNDGTGKYTVEYMDKPLETLNHHVYGTCYRSAEQIILNLLNDEDNEVRIPDTDLVSGKKRYIKDEGETLIVLQKEAELLGAFRRFLSDLLKDEERAGRVYERYHRLLGGYISIGDPFKGEWLLLPGLKRKPYTWQRSGIADILSHKATMLVWSTGAGKGMAMIVAANELKRMGICRKLLFVLPNNSMPDFVTEAHELYPDNHYLIIDPVSFSKTRGRYLEQIRLGNYDGILMAASSYNMLDMSKEYYIQKKKRELDMARSACLRAKKRKDRGQLKKKAERLEKEFAELQMKVPDSTDCFEELDFDAIFIDECQNYRRLTMKTDYKEVTGLVRKGSEKCSRNLEKVHWILKHHENGRAVFATATPLKNSIAEQYIFQRYLQADDLHYLGLDSLKAWLSEFAQPLQYYGVDLNGQNFKLKTGLRFHNLPEMNMMIRSFTNFHQVRAGELSLPEFDDFTDVVVAASEAEMKLLDSIADKLDDLEYGRITRKEYNPLLAIIQARMLSLDIRLMDPFLIPEPGSTKVEACAGRIIEFNEKYPGRAQVVFCNTGVPKKGFNIYDALKDTLLTYGVFKPEEIRYIHEAENAADKQALLRDFNKAKIRVLIGSTEKLGIGLNIQENLVAAHLLDVPWSPVEILQMIGRIIRAGNKCKQVFILRYIKARSGDAYFWEILENKLDFMMQYNSAQFGEDWRDSDDIALTELSCAEAKALALGDNKVKEYAELQNEIFRTKKAYRARGKELIRIRQRIKTLSKEIESKEAFDEKMVRELREATREAAKENEYAARLDALYDKLEKMEQDMGKKVLS